MCLAVPDFLSFFPYGVFWGRFFLATLARLHIALNIIITFVVTMFIIKVGYGVTPRPYPIFSRICWLFSFLVFLLTFVKCRKNVSDFAQKHFVSVANVSQFTQPKKHHEQQCVLVCQYLMKCP